MHIHLFEESSHFANVLMANFSIAFSKKRSLITNKKTCDAEIKPASENPGGHIGSGQTLKKLC